MAKKRKRIVFQAFYGGTLITSKEYIVPKNWDDMNSESQDEYTDDIQEFMTRDIEKRMRFHTRIKESYP